MRWHLPGTRDSFIEAWLAAKGSPAAEKIMGLVERGANLYIFDRAEGAEHLRQAGAHAEARQLAESALVCAQLDGRQWHRKAAEVLLKIDTVAAAATLTELAHEQPRPAGTWFAGVLDTLAEHDGPETERVLGHIAAELSAHPQVEGEELRDALLAQLIRDDAEYAQSVAVAALERTEFSFEQRKDLARALAAFGELDSQLQFSEPKGCCRM